MGNKALTVPEALKNIDIVVASVGMKREEHDALRLSIAVVAQRCARADELEKEAKKQPKKEVKKPKKSGKKEK